MSYYNFLFKKTLKSPGNLIPILILIIGIVSLYVLNITSGDLHSYKNTAKDNYDETKKLEEYYLRELNGDTKYSKKDVQMFENALKDISEQKEWNQEIIELADKEKWSAALNNSVKILNRHIKVNEDSGGNLFPADYVESMKGQILLYKQLITLNQEPDTVGYEKFGFNYMFRVMNSLFPMFFVLIISVFLIEIFLNTYKKGINIEILLPSKYTSTTRKKVLYSIFISISIYIISLIISFALAGIINGTGDILYPMSIYTSDGLETAPIWIIIMKVFILQILSIVNIVLLISLISFFAKNRLITLLISLVITIGSSMALKSIEVLHKFVHLNPFNYFSSGDVVTGLMESEINNTNVTFLDGIISLTLLAIILSIGIFIISQKKEKKQMSEER